MFNTEKVDKLKKELGYWMFANLSSYSVDEFKYTLQKCLTDAGLLDFKKRLFKAREMYIQIKALSTQKQAPVAGKCFFYGISWKERTKEGGILEEKEAIVEFIANVFNIEEAVVTGRIPTEKEFGRFSSLIAQALDTNPYTDQGIDRGQLTDELTAAKELSKKIRSELEKDDERKQATKERMEAEKRKQLEDAKGITLEEGELMCDEKIFPGLMEQPTQVTASDLYPDRIRSTIKDNGTKRSKEKDALYEAAESVVKDQEEKRFLRSRR